MSSFWTVWISFFTLGSIIGCYVLLKWVQKGQSDNDSNKTTGHVYDGIEEYDNPLPKWWVWMFNGTMVFSLVYLVLYPGLGGYEGVLGWTQENQWEREVAAGEAKYAVMYKEYAAIPVAELANNTEAVKTGQRLFSTNCTVCHGSSATGSKGYPNLTDSAWLYGSDADAIKTSIMNGRNGMMPAWSTIIGEDGVKNVAGYVYSLSGGTAEAEAISKGQEVFTANCALCHNPDGTGNTMFGAPNLTDNTWLYGGSLADLETSIRDGRSGKMPAHKDLLGEERVHVVAAYVYSLSPK